VIAVDVSPVMLRYLRARVESSGLTNVDLVQAGFLTYEHRGEPADSVYSRYALHHLPDFWKAVALTRLHGIVRPHGVVRLSDVVYGFPPEEAADRIEPGAPPVVPARTADGAEPNWRSTCPTSTRRSPGCSKR
jgi:SAM-dependent methyltransferase